MVLEELCDFGIETISTSHNFTNMMLELSWSGEASSLVTICIEKIIQINVSQDLDNIDGGASVHFVAIETLMGNASEHLAELGHKITDPDTGKPSRYQNTVLYKLELIGELCIDLVCEKVVVKSKYKTLFDSQQDSNLRRETNLK